MWKKLSRSQTCSFAELGRVTTLTGLNLATNQIAGAIPTGKRISYKFDERIWKKFSQSQTCSFTELGRVTTLRSLKLGTNQITGTIPTGKRLSHKFEDIEEIQSVSHSWRAWWGRGTYYSWSDKQSIDRNFAPRIRQLEFRFPFAWIEQVRKDNRCGPLYQDLIL